MTTLKTPTLPFDSNPDGEDSGKLVYRSEASATAAAEHQQQVCGDDDFTAGCILLSQLPRDKEFGYVPAEVAS